MLTHAIVGFVAALSIATQPQVEPVPELTIRQDERRRTLTVEYGPLALPAGVEYGGELVTVSTEVVIPLDGWLRSFEMELVANGASVPQGLLHHVGLFAPNRRDLFSPAMERIVAFGQETEALRLPGQLGYRVQPGDTLLLLGALYNTSPIDYRSLHLKLQMVYADAHRDWRHLRVLPLYLDVMPPGNRVYDVPPGRSSQSREWSPAVDGRVLALGGHLHQYGAALVLEDVTTGETVWVGTAHHDEDHELLGVSRKVFHRGQPMRADHVYRVTAIYDNPTGQVVRGAMGKIGGVFLPDRGQDVPPVDPTHPEYIRDWHAMVNHEHEVDHVRATEQTAPLGHD